MDTSKRIDIALQQKERTRPSNDVGEEELDEHTHILNSGETSNNNEYTVESIFLHALFSRHLNIRWYLFLLSIVY
jgi:hypothetical protein